MTSRLVLGYGSLAQALVADLADGPGDLTVVTDDESAVRTLREEGTAAEAGDVTAAETYDGRSRPDTVVVATDDAARNVSATEAARSAFPRAYLLAYAGADPTPEATDALASLADDVVDPLDATVDQVLERAGDESLRARKLLAVLRGFDGPLAIVAHDNPDPDAIASAVALERLADLADCDADICYFGDISHQENRAFVNLLEFDLVNLEPGADLAEYAGVALVDHSRPGVNDGLPADTPVDIVIDHHPPRLPVDARFVDLRSEVGATSTLLVDYLRRLEVEPDEETATGLLFGIRVDTDEFTREVSPHDFVAAAHLLPFADLGTLERIDSPNVSADTLETIARAIRNRRQHGQALLSGVGELANRDALAQAADRLLDLEGVATTFVYGIDDGTVYVSARSRGTDLDLGETLRDAFGQIGSAGGHADMAGAQLSLGYLDSVEADDESLAEVIDSVVTDRFLDAYDPRTHRVITDVYPDEFFGTDHPGVGEYTFEEAGTDGDSSSDGESRLDGESRSGSESRSDHESRSDGDGTDAGDEPESG